MLTASLPLNWVIVVCKPSLTALVTVSLPRPLPPCLLICTADPVPAYPCVYRLLQPGVITAGEVRAKLMQSGIPHGKRHALLDSRIHIHMKCNQPTQAVSALFEQQSSIFPCCHVWPTIVSVCFVLAAGHSHAWLGAKPYRGFIK